VVVLAPVAKTTQHIVFGYERYSSQELSSDQGAL